MQPLYIFFKHNKLLALLAVTLFFSSVFGGVAGTVINFSPSGKIGFPSSILSIFVSFFTLFILFKVNKYGFTLNPELSKFFNYILIFICSVVLYFIFFLLFTITIPAILTNVFGSPYLTQDTVTKVEKCTGRDCLFCSYRMQLANHEKILGFCPSDSELEYLKVGNKITIVGYNSSLGIRISEFN